MPWFLGRRWTAGWPFEVAAWPLGRRCSSTKSTPNGWSDVRELLRGSAMPNAMAASTVSSLLLLLAAKRAQRRERPSRWHDSAQSESDCCSRGLFHSKPSIVFYRLSRGNLRCLAIRLLAHSPPPARVAGLFSHINVPDCVSGSSIDDSLQTRMKSFLRQSYGKDLSPFCNKKTPSGVGM